MTKEQAEVFVKAALSTPEELKARNLPETKYLTRADLEKLRRKLK